MYGRVVVASEEQDIELEEARRSADPRHLRKIPSATRASLMAALDMDGDTIAALVSQKLSEIDSQLHHLREPPVIASGVRARRLSPGEMRKSAERLSSMGKSNASHRARSPRTTSRPESQAGSRAGSRTGSPSAPARPPPSTPPPEDHTYRSQEDTTNVSSTSPKKVHRRAASTNSGTDTLPLSKEEIARYAAAAASATTAMGMGSVGPTGPWRDSTQKVKGSGKDKDKDKDKDRGDSRHHSHHPHPPHHHHREDHIIHSHDSQQKETKEPPPPLPPLPAAFAYVPPSVKQPSAASPHLAASAQAATSQRWAAMGLAFGESKTPTGAIDKALPVFKPSALVELDRELNYSRHTVKQSPVTPPAPRRTASNSSITSVSFAPEPQPPATHQPSPPDQHRSQRSASPRAGMLRSTSRSPLPPPFDDKLITLLDEFESNL